MNQDIPQYPPRAPFCEDGKHSWHCDDTEHEYECFCTKCDYQMEWLLK